MENFRKTYKLKIISLLVAMTFFVSSTGYGKDLSNRFNLRPPLLTNSTEGGKRVEEMGKRVDRREFFNSIRNAMRSEGEKPTEVTGTGSEWVDGAINTAIERREFIKYLAAGTGAVAVGIAVGGGVSLYDRINYFSFQNSHLAATEQSKGKNDVDRQNICFLLKALKSEKMPDEKVREYCDIINKAMQDGFCRHDMSENEFSSLLYFLTEEDMNGIISLSTKWRINEVKLAIVNRLTSTGLLFRLYKSNSINFDRFHLIMTTLEKLTDYKENFLGPDKNYDKYFSGIDPKFILETEMKAGLYDIIDFPLASYREVISQYPALKNFLDGQPLIIADKCSVVYWFFETYGLPDDVEKKLLAIRQAEEESIHYVPERYKLIIKELQKLPKKLRKYCIKLADIYNIPPHVLVNNIIHAEFGTDTKTYNVGEGIAIYRRDRADTPFEKNLGEVLDKILPNSIKRLRLGRKLNDVIGGALDGHTSIGLFQIRKIWVTRYDLWERFGFSPQGDFSDIEFILKALEPKYNIEAGTKMLRSIANQVEEYRLDAINFNKPPFILPFLDETQWERFWVKRNPLGKRRQERLGYDKMRDDWITALYYRNVPAKHIFGKNDWMLAIYHPIYFETVPYDLALQKLIVQSGILDERPVVFVSDSELEIIKKQRNVQRDIAGGV